MERVSRGSGFGGAVRYIFANFNASFLCSSYALAARDERRAISKMGTLAHRLRPDRKKPVWHQALRLPRGEVIPHEKFREIANDYMRRMGWNPDTHQYIVIVSDDPQGQHIHIIGNRVGIDGSIYLGKNENLISTRVCQELERDYGLVMTKGPEYVVDERGVPRAVYRHPKDKKAKCGEVRMEERQAREGVAKPLPRKTLQRALKAALAAGRIGGMPAFLVAAESEGVRVVANIAATGRVNGLSFETAGVPFKASQLGAAYAWESLATAVGYDKVRDRALLEARSRRHASDDQLPSLCQPVPHTRELPAPPAAAKPIVVPRSAPKEAPYVQHYQPTYRQARGAAPAPHGRLALAGGPPIDSVRSMPGGTVDAADGARRAEHSLESVVPRDPQLLLGRNRNTDRRLRPGPRATDLAAGGLKRDANLLGAARFAQELRHDTPAIEGDGRITVHIELLAAALDGYVAKQGRWGILYIRKSDSAYAMVDTGSCIKLASTDDSIVRAALATAAGKWTELRLSGSEAFMARAVREAVRLGICDRIANPELQGLIAHARRRLATECRVAEAGIADGRGREVHTLKANSNSNPSLKKPSPGRSPK